MKVRDVGTILKTSPLGDHGLIVTWCTALHGVLRTAARNARKPGSDFTGHIDSFYEAELVFSLPARGDLSTLHSAVLLSARLPLRSNLSRLCLAGYLSRLLLATVEPGDANPEWHLLISGALDYIAASSPRLAILEHFEKRLASLHGIYSPVIPPHQTLLRHFQSLPSDRLRFLDYSSLA
ncbi:MAG: recombination protein O N-terminal domain-containing protein [Akkermansia sp.]|nr:recombination protein O N-terminal domain-containing protein [Akkermansia sp.]